MDTYQEAAELRSALRQFMRRSEEVARRHGLTPNQYVLLVLIKGTPDGSERSTVTDLVDRIALSQSTVTELVQRAERAGLLQREHAAVQRLGRRVRQQQAVVHQRDAVAEAAQSQGRDDEPEGAEDRAGQQLGGLLHG